MGSAHERAPVERERAAVDRNVPLTPGVRGVTQLREESRTASLAPSCHLIVVERNGERDVDGRGLLGEPHTLLDDRQFGRDALRQHDRAHLSDELGAARLLARIQRVEPVPARLAVVGCTIEHDGDVLLPAHCESVRVLAFERGNEA